MHEWARAFLRAGLINDVCDWSVPPTDRSSLGVSLIAGLEYGMNGGMENGMKR